MGDIADYYLDQAEDYLILQEKYFAGEISEQEAFELGIIESAPYPPPKTCRCCGTTNLYWQKCEDKWRLFEKNTNELHHCPVNPLEEL